MKVAVIHYWLVTWRGGERVLEDILNLFPDADLYTNVLSPAIQQEHFRDRRVFTTFVNSLPFAKRHYQKYLPLMPFALEQLDLTEYDLVISSESGPAKNVLTRPDAIHICYCHSPMRYAWDMYRLYFNNAGLLTRILGAPLMHYMRIVDRMSADRVDYFLANSSFIAKRIQKCYRRDSAIIHPPVDLSALEYRETKEDYYLLLGQLTLYKRPDIVINAFKQSNRKLVVVGEGEMLDELKAQAGSNISFRGRTAYSDVVGLLSRARALLFPGIEDFGIVPLEAMGSGTPVIAFGKGGALETIVGSPTTSDRTGVFFYEQSADALNTAINEFEQLQPAISPKACRKQAELFSREIFRNKLYAFVREHAYVK